VARGKTAATTKAKEPTVRPSPNRLPGEDALGELEVPSFRSIVKVTDGKLVVQWKRTEDATAYDVQVRRTEGHPIFNERAVENVVRTEFTDYPIGPPGAVPQVRIRAVAEDGLSQWSEWVAAIYDFGGGD
jgi:hypothetical protein